MGGESEWRVSSVGLATEIGRSMSGRIWAPNVRLPVFMWQVKDDWLINNPSDGQGAFDALGSTDKELHWIEGTTKHCEEGYHWFGRHPEKALAYLARYMG